jgi:plastocyanin
MTAPDQPQTASTENELSKRLLAHGFDRRTVLQALGFGAMAAAGTGVATARHDSGHPPRLDPYYGYSMPTPERLPGSRSPDASVGLHVHLEALEDGDPTTIPFHFSPMGLRVETGGIVQFDFQTPEHTVTAYHENQGRQRRVPEDVPPFSSPVIGAGGSWLYQFDTPGTYDLFCAPHEFFGMVMRVVVGDPDDPAYDGTVGPTSPQGPRPPVSRPALTGLGITSFPFPTAQDVFETDALSVQNIDDQGTVSVETIEDDL